MKLPRKWFLPDDHDVLAVLSAHLAIALDMVDVVGEWTAGGDVAAGSVRLRDCVARSRGRQRELSTRVAASFSTPLAAEDLVELGERIHEAVAAGYALVREAELAGTGPDAGLREGVAAIAAAMTGIVAAAARLPHYEAAALVDAAAEHLTGAEHAYRHGVAALFAEQDVRVEVRRRDLYRRMELLSTATARIAHRIWYAVYKAS